MKVFLLAYIMHVNNFEPVMIRDCVAINISNSKIEALKQVKALGSMGLKCEQHDDTIAYSCVNSEKGLIGRITVLKDIKECKSQPARTSKDMKNLSGWRGTIRPDRN